MYLWVGVQAADRGQVDIPRDEADTQLAIEAKGLEALDEHAPLMEMRGSIPVICSSQPRNERVFALPHGQPFT